MPTCYKCEFDKGHHSSDCELATEADLRAERNDQGNAEYHQDHGRGNSDTYTSYFTD